METRKWNTSALVVNGTIAILVLLWSYTVCSKLANLAEFKRQMFAQSFGNGLANLLLWAVPITEITAIMLLVLPKSRFKGLVFSFGLLMLFTGYIILVLLGFYDRVPCSCGGVLKQLSWQGHFWFNLFFLFLNAIGLYHAKKKT